MGVYQAGFGGMDAAHSGTRTVVPRGESSIDGTTALAIKSAFAQQSYYSPGVSTSDFVFFVPGTLIPARSDSISIWMGFDHLAGDPENNRIIIEGFAVGGEPTLSYISQSLTGIRERFVQLDAPGTHRLRITAVDGCGIDDLTVGTLTPAVASPWLREPSPIVACPASSATFTVTASAASPFAYQWRKNGTPINTLANPSAATATLTLTNVGPADVASYDCIVSHACGSTTSNPATLTVCLADFNCDSAVDGDDVIAFFNAWDAGEIAADVNRDDSVDGDDVILFFGAWDQGC